MGAIIHKNPDPLNAPPALQAIVEKCLSKSPEDRFQTATELRGALEAASTGGYSTAVRPRKRLTPALVIAASLLVSAQ